VVTMNEIVEAMTVVESCVVALSRLAWPSLCTANEVLPCLGACARVGPGEPPSLTQNPFGPPNRRISHLATNANNNNPMVTIFQSGSHPQRRYRLKYYSCHASIIQTLFSSFLVLYLNAIRTIHGRRERS
jgi:hypothetical protein